MGVSFGPARQPWWCSDGAHPESVVRLDSKCLGLRVRLASGERVTMPMGPTTFAMRSPRKRRDEGAS